MADTPDKRKPETVTELSDQIQKLKDLTDEALKDDPSFTQFKMPPISCPNCNHQLIIDRIIRDKDTMICTAILDLTDKLNPDPKSYEPPRFAKWGRKDLIAEINRLNHELTQRCVGCLSR